MRKAKALEGAEVRAKDMVPGRQYKLSKRHVAEAEFDNGQFFVVHERGELDLQSKFGVDYSEEVEEVSEYSTKFGRCPACYGPTEPVNNPDNPVCCSNDLMCSCGWMGKRRRRKK